MKSHSIAAIECDARVQAFFAYARERYNIMVKRRAGQPKPWTDDPILQSYRFCNIFREDDKVTEWFKLNVRGPFRDHPHVVFATMAFRYFNLISTCEMLQRHDLFIRWDSEGVRAVLKNKKPLVSAAYMCTTPCGMNKLEGLIKVIDLLWAERLKLYSATKSCTTMESLVEYLATFYYMGNFRAYECACDLQYTDAFHPTDTLTWANPGPGAERGLCYILTGEMLWPAGQRRNREQQIDCMRMLLGIAGQVQMWPGHWQRWDMRTVEHTLCEFFKYRRCQIGGRCKQNYPGV